MSEMNTIARSCGVCFQCGRVVKSIAGFMKTVRSIRKIAPLVVLMPLNVYAAAERFPDVQVQMAELADVAALAESPTVAISAPILDATVGFENAVPDSTPGQLEVTASAEGGSPNAEEAGGSPRDEIVNQELASLDVVDTGVLKQAPSLQPAPVVSRVTASLEVVDTGTTRQVQNPHPVEAVILATESPAEPESAAVTTAPGGTADDPAKNYNAGRVETAVATTGNASAQFEVVSDSVVSKEVIRLPYAVLLAILALMSMIPVARRKE